MQANVEFRPGTSCLDVLSGVRRHRFIDILTLARARRQESACSC